MILYIWIINVMICHWFHLFFKETFNVLTHFKTCLYTYVTKLSTCIYVIEKWNCLSIKIIRILLAFNCKWTFIHWQKVFCFLMEIYFDILHEKRLLSTITMCSKLLNSYWFCRYIHVRIKRKYIWFYRFQVYLHSCFFMFW